MFSIALLALLCGNQDSSPPQKKQVPQIEQGSRAAHGSVIAPAALPAASTAMYFFLGAPEVGAGYRQGFDAFEFEARGVFHVFELSGLVDAGLKLRLGKTERFSLAGNVALGLKLNSGSRYFDGANFTYVALRPRVGAVMSAHFSPSVQGLLTLDVPLALALNVSGYQFSPSLGIGAEVQVGPGISLLVAATGGVDSIREPLGVPQLRPLWGLKLGIGYRMF
jgi:hypothetical protein